MIERALGAVVLCVTAITVTVITFIVSANTWVQLLCALGLALVVGGTVEHVGLAVGRAGSESEQEANHG